ncbi:MAG: T9SS type A sorting domain-containing protein [Ignavibacteria bacterium]|nr:T9SS type A sorting domain-containing protein [Ignavibacteria bacterium]
MKYFLTTIFLLFSSLVQAQPQWVIYTTNNSGLPSNLVGSILIDSNNVKWITTNNGFVKLQDTTWTVYDTLNSGLPQNACGVIRKDKRNNIWLSCGGKGLVKYDGVNWTVYNNENTGFPVNWTAVGDVDDYNNKWIVGAGLFKFNDTNWIWFNTGNSGLPTNETKCTFVKNNIVWVGTYMGGVVKFDGVNWTVYNTLNSGLPSNWVRMITSDLQNNLWFATFFGGLAKYNESQNLWTVYNTTNSGLHHNNLYSVYVDNNSVKWIGGGGMAIFNDTTWQIFTYPFITEVFNFSKDRYGNMWICSDIGLYIYNPAGVVGIENNTTIISENYLFIQNYPNPFNSETKIKYQVARGGETFRNSKYVSLKIYDILGKEITTLVNKKQDIGEYEVSFNGLNLAGGIYFAVLKIDTKVKVHKIVLQK